MKNVNFIRRAVFALASLGVLCALAAGSFIPQVRPPLEIVSLQWKPKIPVVGAPLRLDCETSNPDAVVWFTLDGANTSRSTSVPLESIRNGDEFEPSTLWTLHLDRPEHVDSGDYECHAQLPNDLTSHAQRSAKINFIPAVANVVIETEPIVMTKLGDGVELSCKVCASDNASMSLLATAKWFRNEHLLSFRSESSSYTGDTYCSRLTATLNRVQIPDVGLYSCVVHKLIGSVSSLTYLTVTESFVPSRPSVQLLPDGGLMILWMPPQLPSQVANVANYQFRVYMRIDDEYKNTFRVVVKESLFGGSQGYVWHDLFDSHFYTFDVAACVLNAKIKQKAKCAKLSERTLVTHFKTFAHPEHVNVVCHHDNVSHGNILDVTWEAPAGFSDYPLTYRVQVVSASRYIDVDGINQLDEQVNNFVLEKLFWRRLVTSNTNYSVRICVVTASGCGNDTVETNSTSCSTPPSVPNELPLFNFHNIASSDETVQLQVDLKRVSEREGPIRCYRVVLYKLRAGQLHLPDSLSVEILTYDKVHSEGGFGAYVAEAFDSQNFQQVVTLGDESHTNCGVDSRSVRDDSERAALENADGRNRRDVDGSNDDNVTILVGSTTTTPLPLDGAESMTTMMTTTSVDQVEELTASSVDEAELNFFDGKLDPDTKYSGFVEIVVIGFEGKELKRRSRMAPIVRTSLGTQSLEAVALPAALGVICGLFAVIVTLAIALCILRRRGLASRPAGVPFLPLPSTKPIRKNALIAAYKERHKDSNLLFQREYEMLPEYFNDRTSRSSDSVDNLFKNRYPDIKAYDQTRVKLSVINDISGSDYINANYVLGFRNKKFICAQGPVDKTVNDFWRMIWEQRVEIIAMVTGLEENGKTKCAKYWPDEGEAKYEDLTVSANDECVYGEYAVRRFTVRNGGDGSGSGRETPGSNEIAPDVLNVVQFHYLAWRDFLAPDCPGGILKFIKRIREVHKASANKGHILVHCSAGVGRTGTLVTIDSLLDQMEDEGQVDIFHFVASIRRHRNFLVQSLTQYIFIYRALAEYAQFDDTEIETKELSSTVERLEKMDLTGKSFILKEFEKLNDVLEDHKTTDIGNMDVNVNKNRYEQIIPFDNNRIVLTPLASSSNSTYINASIIQGYDRSAAYIVTQDPLESTYGQFWRMVHEHCVPIVVMLSEPADESAEIVELNKCPKYWPDSKESYDHVVVSHQKDKKEQEGSEEVEEKNVNGDRDRDDTTTVRRFLVTNNKSSSSHNVTQVQFKGWGTDGLVPASTQKFLTLVELVHELQAKEGNHDPVVVHCSGGSERSGLFVASSILMQQAKAEKRIDVFHVIGNLRRQRKLMITDVLQYRFCYKAIDEYARTHELDK